MIASDATRAEMVVTDEDFQRLLAAVDVLSPAQLAALEAAIKRGPGPASVPPEVAVETSHEVEKPAAGKGSVADIEARFSAAPHCPHCQSADVVKWGSANGLKRYRCKPCNVTFNALTATPLAQLHKRELWGGQAQALIDGLSLRKAAARLGVHVETAFRWRHRFLKAPKALKPKALEGTVEADETYFLHSEKGSRKLKRPARKRGGKAKKRGLSAEQVPILIARDRSKATTDQILPDRSMASISAVLGPIVAKSAVLVSDGAGAYRAFADKANIVHVQLNLSQGEHTWGIYHVQNVNNYCSRLKSWMRRFNGVATKYLDSYLGWHRTDDREGNTLNASRVLVAAWG
jgi:transposase-like protein